MSGQIEGSSLMQGCSWSEQGYTLVLRNVLLEDGKLYHLRIERDTPITGGIAENLLPDIQAICQRSIFRGVDKPAEYAFEHTSGDDQCQVYLGDYQVEGWTNQRALQTGFRELNGLLDAAVLTDDGAEDDIVEQEVVSEPELPPIPAPSKHAAARARRFPGADERFVRQAAPETDSESEMAAPLPARQSAPQQAHGVDSDADDEGYETDNEPLSFPTRVSPAAAPPQRAPAPPLDESVPPSAPAPQGPAVAAAEPVDRQALRRGLRALLQNPDSRDLQEVRRNLINEARQKYDSVYQRQNIDPSEMTTEYSGQPDLYRAALAARWVIAQLAHDQSPFARSNIEPLVKSMAQEIIASDKAAGSSVFQSLKNLFSRLE